MLHGKWLEVVKCKSEKHYPVVMKDISHVKIVSLYVRCWGEHSNQNLLIVPYGSKDNVKSPYEINFVPVMQLASISPCHGEGCGFEFHLGLYILQL